MLRTPLQNAIAGQAPTNAVPVQEREYRGSITASHFGAPKEEFRALQSGCAVYDMGFRARLSLKGSDRVRWMNGMVTNNIRDLAVGRGAYAFLLNPQGRILGDMDVHNLGETLEVETDQSQIDKIAATFEHFIIMDDVEVTNVSDNWTSLGVAGPKSRELLTAAGILFPELQPLQLTTPDCNCDCGCLACTIVRGDSTSESYEIWLAPKDVYKTWQALISAGATPVGCESLEILRISVGTPVYGVDIRERDLPQETEQTRALNFNKGCYVGQEIVERIRSRGNVHRKFIGLLLERVETISPGAKIVVGEKEVGEVTSFAILPSITEEQAIALGYIRREAGMPGQKVEVGDAKVRATVIQLPMQSAYQQAAEDHVLNRA